MKDVCTANPDWGCLLLRYFNPVGAHFSGEMGEDPQGTPNNLMPYISQVAVGRRDKLMIYGHDYDTPDGTGVRDYIHIMDVAEGHVAAVKYILRDSCLGTKVFNLGTGGGASVLEVVKTFEEASGRKIPYELMARRPGDVASSYATCERAEKELKWKSKLSLYDMCKLSGGNVCNEMLKYCSFKAVIHGIGSPRILRVTPRSRKRWTLHRNKSRRSACAKNKIMTRPTFAVLLFNGVMGNER